MGTDDSPQSLLEVIEKTTADHEVQSIFVRPGSIEKVGKTYSFEVVWNFDTAIPTFEFADSTKTLSVGDNRAQVKFTSTVRTESEEAYHIRLYNSRMEPTIEQLELALTEITLTIDRLVEIVEQTNRIEYIAVATPPDEDGRNITGHSDSDQTGEPSLSIRVSYSAPHWYEDDDGFYTKFRFDHVAQLQTPTETVPVEVETTRFPEEGANPRNDPVIAGGTWLHTSEYLADATPVEKLHCRERLNTLNLSSLLHTPPPERPDGPPME
jgi:hypothetical protein